MWQLYTIYDLGLQTVDFVQQLASAYKVHSMSLAVREYSTFYTSILTTKTNCDLQEPF